MFQVKKCILVHQGTTDSQRTETVRQQLTQMSRNHEGKRRKVKRRYLRLERRNGKEEDRVEGGRDEVKKGGTD